MAISASAYGATADAWRKLTIYNDEPVESNFYLNGSLASG